MISGSTVDRLEIFTASATLAAHASFNEHGFRLRDLRFFTELFLNWVEDINAEPASIQNTQLARYLTQLIGQGFAKKSLAEKHQHFRLTRLGIIELLTRIISSTNATQPSTTLFRICFVASYRPRLKALVEREKAHFPHSLQIELTALLDIDTLIQHEIKRVQRALQRIERRIDDALKTSALTKNRLASQVPFSQVVQEVESRYPYELNSMKPLHELITSIAPDQRRWELEEGNLVRAHTLWEPQRGMLTELLHQLKALHAAYGVADKTPVGS